VAKNIPPPEVQDYWLTDADGNKLHLLQLSAAKGEQGPIVFLPPGAIDFPVNTARVNQLEPPVGRIRLRWNGTGLEFIDDAGAITAVGGGGGASDFLGLTDTPGSYAGQAGLVPVVNLAETALEFVAQGGPTFDPDTILVNASGSVLTNGTNVLVSG